MLDPIIAQIKQTHLYREIEAELDRKRLAGHHAALGAIAAHVKTTSPQIERARHALQKAESEVRTLEPGYHRALAERQALQAESRTLKFSIDATQDRLTGVLDMHIPPVVLEVGRALIFVGHDLRSAFRARERREAIPFGEGTRVYVTTNLADVDKAQAKKQDILTYCASLRTKPTAQTEIMGTLAAELGELRKLSRVVNVEIDWHLPEPFKLPVGKREITGECVLPGTPRG